MAHVEPTPAQAMHEKPQPEGKPLLVTMAAHQPGEGKGKGKDGGRAAELLKLEWYHVYPLVMSK